ncbi:radical SAM additional 4Fe4S-binding SPASM domain-containing protein [Sarcina sp. DSM 11001]|uniref:radical SAM protein n=1 Tax=Sarcina sp. DSM 11001 TaxID=1798184 RepID=UPI0008802690|nr:radical SAM protein [Sarcina sp. DSM 11001]SDL69307.1 radical SAM additional 4Fe4S-binding SPASM domain-containing protein [Sarcina sp. DSM 11001]
MNDIKKGVRFSPSLCLTHSCNLDCIYCYQNHDGNNRMSFETAKKAIDWIFANHPDDMQGIELSFIGGEPLIEFELIKRIYEYTTAKYPQEDYIFYATTNGTVLNESMKDWFRSHKDRFVLGLSLDGLPETHNLNRSNSFGMIDIDFFRDTWPGQGVKMTLSEYSLDHLADNIIFLHSLGFKEINGVNLFEGTFDWSDEKYIKAIIPQLRKLVDFYVEHDDLVIDQMLGRQIDVCVEENRPKRKWCGIGTGTTFFDTDGSILPCPFVTPMTFSQEELKEILNTDFKNEDSFIDDDCFNNCYIYPICPTCPGANYLVKKTFKTRDKSKCRIQKLITLYAADLQAKRVVKNVASFPEDRVYNLITAIEKIKELYMPEFEMYRDIL